jgi:hypothetical protein
MTSAAVIAAHDNEGYGPTSEAWRLKAIPYSVRSDPSRPP